MIPQSQPQVIPATWQSELAGAIKDPAILLARLGLSAKLQAIDAQKIKQFPLRVPQSYVDKMRYGDPADPLLRQVFPLIDESYNTEGFVSDPVGDLFSVKAPGILHKYHGRALLVTTGACAIHCRYCFRRHFPYTDSNPLASHWQQSLEVLRQDSSITEIILSGGDPLSLTDNKLAALVSDLEQIPHIKRLRIHTRLPIVLPQRIDQSCLNWLQNNRFKVVMVIHANHANELDKQSARALTDLKQAGCQLYNQAVLLKGVNDDLLSLCHLSERLNDLDTVPYYLHLLDRVQGASHFEVSEHKGIELVSAMRASLPGYLVPRLVREQQGADSKTIIC